MIYLNQQIKILCLSVILISLISYIVFIIFYNRNKSNNLYLTTKKTCDNLFKWKILLFIIFIIFIFIILISNVSEQILILNSTSTSIFVVLFILFFIILHIIRILMYKKKWLFYYSFFKLITILSIDSLMIASIFTIV